jgi:hypothetical protein
MLHCSMAGTRDIVPSTYAQLRVVTDQSETVDNRSTPQHSACAVKLTLVKKRWRYLGDRSGCWDEVV